jgi:alkanesulfonate monooxygenase SsuD/methylene tetrahydromethanopterin reductase-like flavin-dependent oxidoreductase (luciferase family)
VHDITDLEAAGVPGVLVASAEFVQAAAAQAAALGADPVRIFVPHPIQDRTDDEMRTLADSYLEEILAGLVQDGR